MTDEEIIGHFESLGDNCEFGLVQRAAGVEHLGFFRFNWATVRALVKALDGDFADVDRPETVEIETDPNKELTVLIRDYKFRYHTFMHSTEVDVAALRAAGEGHLVPRSLGRLGSRRRQDSCTKRLPKTR